ncbi:MULTISPECIES: branched-chain amino acid ABC transporter permease [Natronorubrum]|uniref:Branched-chain/neutral amino acids ABC transporter permease n=2 Tax=Natronorubrum bangense TaxID=61858 RepID=L9WLF7_9EURY|nr:branched-chain amino acid ABC transporter permease [Natronorubrum bangense]ELY50325.1 branched-chain/neutral amino acids ABC transporter permease [Natronorubrum bangense JCM 10635]QCC54236.1 branched-chain amino acid ABC transporter permease [Natronorubrum bangense]
MSTRLPTFQNVELAETLQDWRLLSGIILFVVLALYPALTGNAYHTRLLTWIMCFAIAAIGFNIVLGYTGLLSFGHAAFFGTGMYTVVLMMGRVGINDLVLLMLLAMLTSGIVGAIIGALTVKTHEIYFALLTLALAQLLYILAIRDIGGLTRGTDGIGLSRPDFFGIPISELPAQIYLMGFYYHFVLVFLTATIILLWFILRSPFGLTLKMIRENEMRAEMTGVPVLRYRVYSMVLSAMIVGLGGALYAVLIGHITPEYLDWTMSGEIVFMALLGGIGTFLGPVVGAGGFIVLQELALSYTEYWHFTMGLVLFVVVLTLREKGIWGGAKMLVERLNDRRGEQ